MRMKLVLLLLLSLLGPIYAGETAIIFGKLITQPGTVLENAVVLVENGTVISIHEQGQIDLTGKDVVDLSLYTGLPGLIDSHVHLTYAWDPENGEATPWSNFLRGDAARTRELGRKAAIRTLEAGVTTVRNMTAFYGNDFILRDEFAAGITPGPRMLVSGLPLFDPALVGGACLFDACVTDVTGALARVDAPS